MLNQDSIHLLKECDAGSKMAVTSLKDMLEHIKSESFYKLIKETLVHHENLGNEIHEYLNKCACSEKETNPIAKGMSWLKTNMKLTMEDNDKTIADLITDGCNMGVKSLKKYMPQYPEANEQVQNLCTKLINIEEQLTKEVAQYL